MPIMGEPSDMLTSAELVERMRGFEISITQGRISMEHDRCPWVYMFSDRSRQGMPPLTLISAMETALVHLNDHHADGIYCANASCSVHFAGSVDIHADT